MKERAYIELEAANLADNTTMSTDCPRCNGGTSKDKAFYITRRDGLLFFVCHRASCGFCGMLSEGLYLKPSKLTKPSKIRHYTGSITELPTAVYELLQTKYGLTESTMNRLSPQWAPDCQMVSYPVEDKYENPVGMILRSYENVGRKRVLTYRATEDPTFMAWYTPYAYDTKALLIVEDVVSAAKASAFCDSVALLGTHMGDYEAKEIAKYAWVRGPRRVILALDADAFNKAVGYRNKYRLLMDMEVVKLEKDIKDMPYCDIERLVTA